MIENEERQSVPCSAAPETGKPTRPIKVLHVIFHFEQGGIERYLLETLRAIDRSTHAANRSGDNACGTGRADQSVEVDMHRTYDPGLTVSGAKTLMWKELCCPQDVVAWPGGAALPYASATAG